MRSFDQLIGDWILAALAKGAINYDDDLVSAWSERLRLSRVAMH